MIYPSPLIAILESFSVSEEHWVGFDRCCQDAAHGIVHSDMNKSNNAYSHIVTGFQTFPLHQILLCIHSLSFYEVAIVCLYLSHDQIGGEGQQLKPSRQVEQAAQPSGFQGLCTSEGGILATRTGNPPQSEC